MTEAVVEVDEGPQEAAALAVVDVVERLVPVVVPKSSW